MERHGRDSHALVQGCALMLSLLVARQLTSRLPPPAPHSPPHEDVARDLAVKIANAVGAAKSVQVTSGPSRPPPINDDGAERAFQVQIQRQIAQMLAARGLRLVDRPQDAAAVVAVTCSQNLRERICAAQVRKGDAADIVMATRPHEAASGAHHETSLALELRPLFRQRAPILDVASVGERLLVLDPDALTLYERSGNGWQARHSQPIAPAHVWPRDLRGRLRIESTVADVFLPGVTCRALVEPLTVTCADEHQPWPIGIENTGVMPARNYFTTPEGMTFYGSAELAPEADARWLLVSQDGRLLMLDAERRPLESAAAAGLDVVGVTVGAACAPGTYVMLSSRASGGEGGDTLRLFRVIARQLVPATSPVRLPGPLTALWAAPGASMATAVARDPGSERYEAFQVDVSCDR